MTDQPVDGDDLSGLPEVELALLSGMSGDFAVARRLMAAIACGDADAMAAIVHEIDADAAGGMVALAAATEAVKFAAEPAIRPERLAAVLADRAFRQITRANEIRDRRPNP